MVGAINEIAIRDARTIPRFFMGVILTFVFHASLIGARAPNTNSAPMGFQERAFMADV
jgi:hypothetical protein